MKVTFKSERFCEMYDKSKSNLSKNKVSFDGSRDVFRNPSNIFPLLCSTVYRSAKVFWDLKC